MICLLLQLALFTNPYKSEAVVVGNNYVVTSPDYYMGWRSPYRDTLITLNKGTSSNPGKFSFVQDSIKNKPTTYTFAWRSITTNADGKVLSIVRSYLDTLNRTKRDTIKLQGPPYTTMWGMVTKNLQTSLECVSINGSNNKAVLRVCRVRNP